MSIGLFLMQAKLSRNNPFNEDDLLDLHWMSSVIYLSTASERIRALFIAAVFRLSATEYARGKYIDKNRNWYTTPFIEAIDTLTNPSPELGEALAKGPTLAEEIRRLREQRNELIHELATAIGRRRRASLDQRPPSDELRSEIDFAALQNVIKENEAKRTSRDCLRQSDNSLIGTRFLCARVMRSSL